jgi:3-dehydrosphinganine reductase
MGKSLGRQLATKGANVIIVARNVEKLKAATEYIRAGAKDSETQRFHYIGADLSSHGECARVIQEATLWNKTAPDIVWCCAGTSHPTLFVNTPPDKLEEQMKSNYLSSAWIAHAAVNSWLRPLDEMERGGSPSVDLAKHIIFTSSVVAFYPIAGYAPYSPPKCALRSLSDTLSMELKMYASKQVIRSHTIFPATIYTEGYDAENKIKSDLTKMLEDGDPGQTADECAKSSIAGLEKGEELITTTLLGRAMMSSMLGASQRNGWAVLDTVMAWVTSWVMPIVRWDMDGKVSKWGVSNGFSGQKINA